MHPLVLLPPRHSLLTPLPSLGHALPLEHSDNLGRRRAVLWIGFGAEQRDLRHFLDLLPGVIAVQVAINDGVETPFCMQLLDLQIRGGKSD